MFSPNRSGGAAIEANQNQLDMAALVYNCFWTNAQLGIESHNSSKWAKNWFEFFIILWVLLD